MSKNLSRLSLAVSAALVGALILVGATFLIIHSSASDAVSHSPAPKQQASTTVTIPRAQELFSPFIQTIAPNTTLIWQNNDTVEHTVSTTWDHSTFLNPEAFSMTVEAGQSVKYTFTKPGLYHYFDNTQATWDKAINRVVAHKGIPNYPLAMDGVIWVQGPVSGLLAAEKNSILNGQDDFATEFLAIPQGGAVSWHNQDSDGHTLASVIGWSGLVNSVLMKCRICHPTVLPKM